MCHANFWIRQAIWPHFMHKIAAPISRSSQCSWWGVVLAEICSPQWVILLLAEICSPQWVILLLAEICSAQWVILLLTEICSAQWVILLLAEICSGQWVILLLAEICSAQWVILLFLGLFIKEMSVACWLFIHWALILISLSVHLYRYTCAYAMYLYI